MIETPEQRSRTMRQVKGKDTGPELRVRRAAHAMGYRYRLHRKDLPGKPDIVFPSRRKIIFVHGCFWHGHNCKRGARLPKANAEYWREKIATNKKRDSQHREALEQSGWRVLVLWECQLADNEALTGRLREFLEG